MDKQIATLTGATASIDDRKAAADEIAKIFKKDVVAAFGTDALTKIAAALGDKKNAVVRQGALLAITAIAKVAGLPGGPFLIPLLPAVIDKIVDTNDIKAAADECVQAIMKTLDGNGIRFVVPYIFDAAQTKYKWQSRVYALAMVGKLSDFSPARVTQALPEIIPLLSGHMGDARPEVSREAEASLLAVCAVVNNKDIEPFIPVLVSCIARPSEVSECVYKLSATTFVQAVEPPTLAIIVPVLERGLKERAIAVKRKVAIIIENMCKLVEVPAYAAPFLPKLLPGLDRAKEEVSDPECRDIAARAHKVLLRAAGEDGSRTLEGETVIARADPATTIQCLKDLLAANKVTLTGPAAIVNTLYEYMGALACSLSDAKEFEDYLWNKAFVGQLVAMKVAEADAQKVVKAFLEACYKLHEGKARVEEEEEEGETLCDCEFSLAYGGKILLNSARMHLKRGHRYGLCGHNGCGKSTLMRAIANGQVENFPSPEEVRTVYVEHDIQADISDYCVVDYVMADPRLPDREEIIRVLTTLGFSQGMQNGPITALSGGWKMKLALARAMLLKADIMLLDEPTNHLDKINVAWLINYLKGLTNVTCIIVSHDSLFLDSVCTDIMHYESFKLKRYKGNLSEFVKKHPEARSYYELAATPFSFKFPEPGMLEGINSKGKAILKMAKVSFTYPGTERQILADVTINCSLSSRVVVVGANGAGKSTMIKLLTGEIISNNGMVWKHPNLRLAYVAQHAFHHLEQHLDKTPSEYIQWRYCTGEDKEALDKAARMLTEEEEKKMAEKVTIDGQKFVVEQVLARRKLKNSYEYETKFVGLANDKNQWLPRKWLEDHGFGKLVDALDAREAAMAGLHAKPLTAQNIAKHLSEVGLDAEFSLHSRMRGLSGGQKVKVVLGAAMWNNPHMLVLDEPTNYLDRDSLGAFAGAIKDFGGGVIMITHNAEFANTICTETWLVENGRLNVSGESWTADVKLEEKAGAEEVTDAAGNVIKVIQKKKLTKAEMKKRIRERLKKEAAGIELSSEEEWMPEMRKEMGLDN